MINVGQTALMGAAGQGHVECLGELIAAGANVNVACECHGNSALMTATQEWTSILPHRTDYELELM